MGTCEACQAENVALFYLMALNQRNYLKYKTVYMDLCYDCTMENDTGGDI